LVPWRYLISALETFDYVLEIFNLRPLDIYLRPLDIWLLLWRYLIGVIKIFGWFYGDILFLSWRYLVGVPEIFGWCPGDI